MDSEKAYFLEGNIIELVIQAYLRFKIKEGLLEEVSLKDVANTIKRTIKQHFFERDDIFLKEFLVDLRNVAEDEGYALCDVGVEGNPVINIPELLEELESIN